MKLFLFKVKVRNVFKSKSMNPQGKYNNCFKNKLCIFKMQYNYEYALQSVSFKIVRKNTKNCIENKKMPQKIATYFENIEEVPKY